MKRTTIFDLLGELNLDAETPTPSLIGKIVYNMDDTRVHAHDYGCHREVQLLLMQPLEILEILPETGRKDTFEYNPRRVVVGIQAYQGDLPYKVELHPMHVVLV